MYLTREERARERAEYQAEVAAERLQLIADAKNVALCEIEAAIKKFGAEVDGCAMRNRFLHASIAASLEAINELLSEAAFDVVSDLEDMECSEGNYDLAALADEAAERRADADREERGS